MLSNVTDFNVLLGLEKITCSLLQPNHNALFGWDKGFVCVCVCVCVCFLNPNKEILLM